MQKTRTKEQDAGAKAVIARRLTSRELLQNGDRLVIEHNGQEYTLRVTRSDKLILTK